MDKQRSIEVITEVLNYTKMNAKKFSEAIGSTSVGWLYEIMNPNRPNGLSKAKAGEIVARFPEISLSYLLTGEGTLLKADKINGNVLRNINSSNITPNGNVESDNIDKLINIIAEQSKQIDRLISLLEKKNA